MSERLLEIDKVSKQYRLGMIGGGTLHGDLTSWFARVRGKEDPNSKIGKAHLQHNEKFWALKDVSFNVDRGDALAILGRNGAGKSTMLKLISRITAPTEGEIRIRGRVASLLEIGTGFHPELSGRDNIYLNGAILGMNRAETTSKLKEIVEFSEIEPFIDTPVKRYSSGMYVKLAFSVAAHLDSEIMIMDEVLAVGDVKFQEKCLGKMGDVSRTDGRTILYVSHNMNTIRQLCDRCIVLDKGRIIFDGETEKAISVYMSSIRLSDCSVDLKSMKRSNQFLDSTVTMDKLEVDAESSVFITGSKLKASLLVSTKKNLNHLRLEIPVRSTSGVSATRFRSKPCIALSENKLNRIDFELDISCLAPGRYTLNPVIREINSWGAQRNLDGLVGAYCFEIIPAEGFNDGTEWNPYYSGYYVAPEIQIL